MRKMNRALSFLLALALSLGLAAPAAALSGGELEQAVNASAGYMLSAVKSPQPSSTGGEWAVLGLARSGYKTPEKYYQDYYAALEAYVAASGGVLHGKKYTEYSRVAIALTAIGKNPANVAGYDLLAPLGDFSAVTRQGLAGSVWALIALDCGGYVMPQSPGAEVQATRQMYIDHILSRRLPDGGWSQSGSAPSDPDSTAMALQALAKYQKQEAVKTAVDEAVACLATMQEPDGGYSSYGVSGCESVAQVIAALCELGISPDDGRFSKNGVTLLDKLMSFRLESGGFSHVEGGEADQMASEQGFYALAAALRQARGESSLYRMAAGVAVPPVTGPGVSFGDIEGCEYSAAILALAERGVISGRGGGLFCPGADLTRAEFAAIITRGLGIPENDTGAFADVSSDKWYAGYIGAASSRGIIRGTGGGLFQPDGILTRQEAAVMTVRAAGLCGMDTGASAGAVEALAVFGDRDEAADWALEALAFCYENGILPREAADMEPSRPISRGETAQMLFNMLSAAGLI